MSDQQPPERPHQLAWGMFITPGPLVFLVSKSQNGDGTYGMRFEHTTGTSVHVVDEGFLRAMINDIQTAIGGIVVPQMQTPRL